LAGRLSVGRFAIQLKLEGAVLAYIPFVGIVSILNLLIQEIAMGVLDRVMRLADFVGRKFEPSAKATNSMDDVLILDADGRMHLNYKNQKVQDNINKHLACLSKINLKSR